ncbi:MAG: hypothetical protein HON77_16875 [Gammaproteobacteria bacterium]|nr:hypothetical protein [Gammaproteobacteria bacterium]
MNKQIFLCLMLLWLTTIARADTIVTITTPLGSFDILMLEDDAPIAVANFLGYVNRGDYTGTFLHRSIPDFVLQGGGYRYDPDNNSAPHITTQAPIVNEFKISNTRGTVAMAKVGGDPNSATSEWFVNLANNAANLDSQNGGFTVFGVVINNGMTVVDEIAALPRQNFQGAFTDTPTINFSGSITADIFVTLDSITVTVPSDFDGDGITDDIDSDDDNDGEPDTTDAFPFDDTETSDLDGDGIGDNADADDDNDGVADTEDAFPSDADEWADTDADGKGDNADPDNQTLVKAFLFTNSASANVTVLHIINSSSTPQRFKGTLYNGNGERLGSANLRLDDGIIVSQGRRLLTASDLESIFSVTAWSGPAMLEVTGTVEFDLMSKLTSPSGLVSNTNCVREGSVHNIEGFDSSNKTFVRFINTGDVVLSSISGTLINADGQTIGTSNTALLESLAPKQAVWLNRDDLAELVGTEWDGIVSLKIDAPEPALKLLNLNFVNGETFFNFSCFESSASGYVYLMTNSNSLNISETHIINTSDESVAFTGTLYGRSGQQLGAGGVGLEVGMTEPEGRIILSATDLELIAGAEAWPGPALLAIESTGSFVAMTRLTSPSGLVSNTNCVRQGSVHNIEGVDSKNLTFVRFINQGDQLITAITGRLFDRSGSQLGGPVELIAALGPKEAVFLDRDTLGEKFGQTWEGEASLVVTSDIDEDLRLLNLNLVNDETFFNFSCYEGAAMQESDAGADYDPAQVIASSQAVSATVVFDNNSDREITTLIY